MSNRPRAAFAMAADLPPMFFAQDLATLAQLVDLDQAVLSSTGHLRTTDLTTLRILITGWQCPPIGPAELDQMPNLAAIVHTGGSVKGHVDPQVWARGIAVSSATAANALPVAEYALSMILLASKRALPIAAAYRRERTFIDVTRRYRDIGSNGTVVAIIGASTIGRRLLHLLRPFDLQPWVYDPFVDAHTIAALGGRKVELAEAMSAPIVSIHAPSTAQTRGMIGADELALMPTDGTVINTARGALLDHDALLAEVSSGRLFAVLDVTEPEPLPPDHPLFQCPNVLLTPHLAGSHGNELTRMGTLAVGEVSRLVAGLPLRHPVAADLLMTIA